MDSKSVPAAKAAFETTKGTRHVMTLSEADVEQYLDLRALLDGLEDGFRGLELGEVQSPPRPEITVPGKGFSLAMPAWRPGMPIGVKVTLRRERMYEFLDRLVTIALPRVRDFRGLNPKSFDGRGNYAMGLKEQIVFPEINYDQIDKVRGMDIIVTTTAKTDEEARELLRLFNFPFPREEEEKQAA